MTLIISASYDGSYPEWYDALPEPKVRVDTSKHGGYVSGALVDTFRYGKRHDAYLVVQDSMEPLIDLVAAPFEDMAEEAKTPVVGWARFNMFFDNPEQKTWVTTQYPYVLQPEYGIFGPVFWVTHKTLERIDRDGRLPKAPTIKNEANATERAWAYCFHAYGIKPAFLQDWSEPHLASGDALPFRKIYVGRQ